MIVENDKQALKELERLVLEVYGAVQIVGFLDSEEALFFAKNEDVDVCFSEIVMRPVSGFAITNVLRQKKHYARIHLIADTKQYAIDAWREFANDYLVKPITKEMIVHTKGCGCTV